MSSNNKKLIAVTGASGQQLLQLTGQPTCGIDFYYVKFYTLGGAGEELEDGCPVPQMRQRVARRAFQQCLALAMFQSLRTGTATELARAVALAPELVMAHVMQGYLLAANRDVARVRQTLPLIPLG